MTKMNDKLAAKLKAKEVKAKETRDNKIVKDYMTGKFSYRKLASKYSLAPSTVFNIVKDNS